MARKVSNLMKVILHIPKHEDDLDHNFPIGERSVSLSTPPHVAEVVQLQLSDDYALFKIHSIQHKLTMHNSIGNDMEAETHVYLRSVII